MHNTTFKGIITALVTPFDAAGNLDENGLRRLIDQQVAGGVAGVAVVAGSGEAVNLTDAEQARIVEISVAQAAGRIQVIAGVLMPDTRSAVRWATQAGDMGVDAVLVLTPFYNRPSRAGLVDHFRAVTQATDKPVLLYNNPARTGIGLGIDDYLALAQASASVVGVKECNRDLADFSRLVAELGSHWAILSGEDDLLYPSLVLGAAGGIITTGNILPRAWVDLYAAASGGNYAAARAAHYELLPLIRSVYTLNHPALVKEAIRQLGLPGGRTRQPLADPTPAQCQVITQVLKHPGTARAARASTDSVTMDP